MKVLFGFCWKENIETTRSLTISFRIFGVSCIFLSSSVGCWIHAMIEGLHVSGIINLWCKADAEDATETPSSDSDGENGFAGGEKGLTGLSGDDGGLKWAFSCRLSGSTSDEVSWTWRANTPNEIAKNKKSSHKNSKTHSLGDYYMYAKISSTVL